MEEFCQERHVFFNDTDRVKHSINVSKNCYKEIRGAFTRAFEKIETREDHPNLKKLLENDKLDTPFQSDDDANRTPKFN